MKKQILIEKYIEPSEAKIDGTWVYESWFDKYDDLHSFMGQPAKIGYDSNGQINHQIWYKKGVQHRDGDLPAYVGYNSNGKISYQVWHKKGVQHRDGDLPVYIRYDKNGQISCKMWYKKGVLS